MSVVDDWIEQLPGHLVVFDSNVLHEVVNGPEECIVLYGELDVDIFLWKTKGLDLRRQMVSSWNRTRHIARDRWVPGRGEPTGRPARIVL